MSYLCPNCNSFPLEDCVWWVSGGKTTRWWCAICGEMYDWRQPNRLLVVQTGESFEQAKVFKAHAVPQGLRANLINALKLRANQQEDGGGLIQNIVTNLGMGSKQKKVSRTACGTSSGRIMIAPWMLERHTEARELSKLRTPKVLEGVIGCKSQGESG